MGWKIFKEINKIFSFMTLFVFLAHQLQAEVSKDCLTGILNETENTCLAKSDIINEINKDFQTVFAFGNITSISQPPLVITPKIAIEAPTDLKPLKNLEKPEKISRPLRAKMKPQNDINLLAVVKVLDEKGSLHLNRCLKKLNSNARERHFSGLAEEFETLEKLTMSHKKDTNPLKKIFTRSPSQKECINYLDFILMAG